MAFLHSAQLLYTDCGYPRWSVCFTLPNAIFFYMLFNDFYKVSRPPCGVNGAVVVIIIINSRVISSLTKLEIILEEGQGKVSGSGGQWQAAERQSSDNKRTHHSRHQPQCNRHKAQ